MEQLHEDDIDILDKIIKTCFEKGKITPDVLVLPKIAKTKPEHYPSDKWEHNQKKEYYGRYIEILKNYSGIVEVTKITSGYIIEPINPNLERFIESGGFKKLYKNHLKKEAYEKRIEEGNIASATNSIWTKKTYWWTIGIAVAGFIISIIALIIAL